MSRRKRPSPDWAEYSLYDDLDRDERSCESLPEMCGGTIPGWKYDGHCECGDFLLWEGTMSFPRVDWQTRHDTPNRCTEDILYERN